MGKRGVTGRSHSQYMMFKSEKQNKGVYGPVYTDMLLG